MSDLGRFVAAQQDVYEQALAELTAGSKRGHWMWFVFPQIAGLGRTATSQRYAIADRPPMSSFFATLSRWSLLALASTPPVPGISLRVGMGSGFPAEPAPETGSPRGPLLTVTPTTPWHPSGRRPGDSPAATTTSGVTGPAAASGRGVPG